MTAILRSPFVNVAIDKQHPIEAVPDFRKLNKKRIESERRFIDGIYRDVEKYTDEKKNIIANAIQKARKNHSGKRSFLNKPLTTTEMALAESPLLNNSTAKNHFRF